MELSAVAVTKYKTAIDGLSLSQAQAVLSTSALNDEQKEQILISAGLVQSKNAMTLAEVKELAASMSLSTQKKEEILTTLQGAFIENEWNKERLEAIILAGGEAGAIAGVILAKKAENVENLKNIASEKSLLAILKQKLAVLATNPLTWVGIGVAGVALSIYQTSKAIGEVENKAQELSDTFKQGKTDINNYKSKIEDLYNVINDSGSSIEEVTTARETLMTVQDDLVNKFGDEKETIDLITQAINGQSDALDILTQKQWQATKNEFNQSGFWNNFANWKEGYGTNIDRMVDTMENAWGNIKLDPSDYFSGKYDDIIKKLEKSGWKYSSSSATFVKGGSVEDLYKEILEIQTLVGQDMPDNFLKSLTKDANELKSTLDNYESMWNSYILNEQIFGDENLADSWKEVNDAYSAYKKAVTSGDKEAIESTMIGFATSINKVLDDENVSDSVKDYFEDMYPSLYREVEKWEFKVNILPKYNTGALNALTREDVLVALTTDGYQLGESTFGSILSLAEEYGIVTGTNTEKVQQLLALLEEWGVLQKTITETTPEVDTKFAISPEDAKELDDYQSKIDSISSSLADLHNLTSSDITSLMTEFKDNKDAMAIFEKFGVNGKAGVGDLKSALEEIGKLLMETAKDKVPQMSDAIEDMYSVIGNPKGDVQKLASELEELGDVLNRVRNSEAYSDVEVTNLINKYPELADAVQILTDGYSLEEDAVISLLNARITQSNEAVSYELEDAKAAVAAIQARIQERMAEQRLLQKTGKAAAYLDENGEVVYSGYTSSEEFQNDLKELSIAEEKLRQLEEAFKELYNTGDKDNTEVFDWYATYIERLQSDIDDLGTTIDDVYATWTERNDALQGSIEKTEELVKAQTMAGAEYLKRANAIGLGQAWVDKIQSGEFKIDDLHSVDDADLIKDIQEYIKWYDQYLDMQEQADANQAKLNEQYAQSLELTRSQIDADRNKLEAERQRVQSQIDLNGGNGTVEQYNELIRIDGLLLQLSKDEQEVLERRLGELKKGTQAYEETEVAIAECVAEQDELTQSVKDTRIAILNIPLDKVEDEIENLNEQLDATNDKIEGLDRMIAGAVAYIQDEIDYQEELKQGVQDQIDALQEANDERERALALEKTKYELERAMSQRIVKVYKGEGKGFVYEQDHEAVRDAQDNLSNLEFEETIHALEKQIEYYDDIIEDLQEMQDSWNDIASKAQDFLDIQYALAILGEEGIFDSDRIASFAEEYTNLLQNSNSLENSIEQYEDLQEVLMDNIEAYENGDITLEEALKGMESATSEFCTKTGKNIKDIGTDITSLGTAVGTKTSEMNKKLAETGDTAEKEADDASKNVTTTVDTEAEKQKEIIDGIGKKFQEMCDAVKITTETSSTEITELLEGIAESIKSKIDDMISDATEKIEELKKLKKKVNKSDDDSDSVKTVSLTGGDRTTDVVAIQKFHTGLEKGLVGEKQSGEGLKKVALRKLEPDEVPAVLKVNEAVLTQLQQQNVMSNIGTAFRAGVNTSVIKNNSSTPVVQNINLTLPNVTNESGYNRLVQELQGLQLDALQFAKRR